MSLPARNLPICSCPQCRGIGSSRAHNCPWQEAVSGDDEYSCTCCAACHRQCAADARTHTPPTQETNSGQD